MAETQSRFAAMPTKQKVTILIVVLIVAFIIYEVIGMFGGGSSTPTVAVTPRPGTPPGTPTMPMVSKQPRGAPPMPPGAAPIPPAPHLSKAEQKEQPTPVVAPPPSALLVQQEQIQGQYVDAISQLQMLKIQREIAETNQAIVASNLATVTAEKNITDLLSPESSGGYGKKMGGIENLSPPVPPPPALPPVPQAPTKPAPLSMINEIAPYSVVSVSMELDQWHAVIGSGNKLYNVSIGDVLPTDSSQVIAIDQSGVVVEKGGVQHKLPIVAVAQ